MKKTLFSAVLAFLALGLAYGGSITVTQPDAGSSWRPGTRQTLTWTKSGSMPFMVQITLRREGTPETEDPVLRIADGCANNGSRTWSIPDSLPEGRYFVRVRASRTMCGDSAVFAIAAAGTRGEVAGPDTPIRCDLEMPGVGVEYYNGNIVTWVKNNGPDNLRNHDVTFRLNFPEGGRGEQIITRMISVPVGSEDGVPLLALVRSAIPDAGLRTLVRIDTALSHIADPNQLNQHRDVRLFSDTRTPIDLELRIQSHEVTRVVGGGDAAHFKYRLRATLLLRNKSASPAEIRRMSCRWELQGSSNLDRTRWVYTTGNPAGTLTLGPFRSGEATTQEVTIDFLFHHQYIDYDHRICFELDPEHAINDPNRANNQPATGAFRD